MHDYNLERFFLYLFYFSIPLFNAYADNKLPWLDIETHFTLIQISSSNEDSIYNHFAMYH